MNTKDLFQASAFFQKIAQNPELLIQNKITELLKGIPGTKLLDFKLASTSKQVNIQVEVPAKHSFTASQLGQTLTQGIADLAPGYQVIPTLSFSTVPAKHAQNKDQTIREVINFALSQLSGLQLIALKVQPETKQVLVEVKAQTNQPHPYPEKISQMLTKAIQSIASGYRVNAAITF